MPTILCFFPLLGCFFVAINATRQSFIKRSLPSPIVAFKVTPRGPNITLNWYMQHPFTRELTDHPVKQCQLLIYFKRMLWATRPTSGLCSLLVTLTNYLFFIVGHLDQLTFFILGHLDQLILFIVGHFDQLRAAAPPCPVYLILRFCAEGAHPLSVVTSPPCPIYLILRFGL